MKSIYITSYSVTDRTKENFEYDELNSSSKFSVVQALEGNCKLVLCTGDIIELPERGVALIPAYRLVRILHAPNQISHRAKELRLDMNVVTDGCAMEDVFSFPLILPPEENEKIFVLLNTIKDNDNIFRAYSNLYRLLELILKYAEIKKDKYYLNEVYEYISANYGKQIKISELAKSIGVSEPTVYRMFANTIGCTPIDYINMFRLGQAHRILGEDQDKKIKEVALSCGFDDQLYFSKLYSKTYGMSPREYKRSLLPQDKNIESSTELSEDE